MGPPPISLRVRSMRANIEARDLLRRLDEKELLQKRVRSRAATALAQITLMSSDAGPKLRSMSRSSRDEWDADIATVKQILKRIIERGV